ncbi:MAG: hypothetical protein AB7T14_09590 [Candidatus Methylacidiphilaceae bacterium]
MKQAGKSVPKKPAIDWVERILGALQKAGSKGLPRSRLVPPRKPEAERALEACLRDGRLRRIGPAQKALYFLEDCAPGARQAAESIGRGVAQFPGRLFLEKELGRFCSRGEAFFLREAVEELVREKILLRLTRGKSAYYVHGAGLGLPQAPVRDRPFDPKVVQASYRKIVDEEGFLDVRIADLAARAEAPLEPLKAWLLEESRAGRAHLARGDWSLATEEERKAAVSLDGRPYLLVRLESQP